MKFSILTPTHDPRRLRETYDSVLAQSYENWEWIILLNGKPFELPEMPDPRVRVIDTFAGLVGANIGFLKKKVAESAKGDVLVELDHDDLLTPNCLSELRDAFRDEQVDFAFSNFAEFVDGTNAPSRYNSQFGWLYRTSVINDVEYQEAIAPPAEPPYITNITHAPNHVRAWRRSFYEKVGGHDASYEVADDFDLVVRTYVAARKIVRIQKLLYLYRKHGDNTHGRKNALIQTLVRDKYLKSIEQMMLRWCSDKDLVPIDLGAAHGKPEGFVGCDVRKAPGVKKVFNLEETWPFSDDSVGVIRCQDVLEHVSTEKKIHFFNEAWRTLAPGGALLINVPSANGNGAHMDPTHRSYWNVQSFWYHTMEDFQRYVRPAARHSFMTRELTEYFPSKWHQENKISYVRAHLFAVKEHGHPHPMPIPSMVPPRAEASS
jgi:predicted SAM-dependent methyltransferase